MNEPTPIIPIVGDCPECRGVRTVFFGVCDICFAEFDEWHPPELEPIDA